MFRNREPIEKETRDEVYHKFSGHCAYCGLQMGVKGFHVDHVIPVAAGGPDHLANFFPACRHCNLLKSDSTLDQFRKCVEDYHEKSGSIVAERFGSIKILGPIKVEFWFEKHGYTFPEELVRALMVGQCIKS